jgi:hypothetical protein
MLWLLAPTALALPLSCVPIERDPAPPPRARAVINGTEGSGDDLVIAAAGEDGPAATLEVFIDASGDTETEMDIFVVAPEAARVEPESATAAVDAPARFQVHASSPSAAEGGLLIELRADNPDGPVVGEARLTAIGGIKIGFSGAFSFFTSNDNGARASSDGRPFTECRGDPDPFIHRATPLPCEGFTRINQMIIEDIDANARFEETRPTLGLFVTELKTFEPSIDLAGRDTSIDVGALVTAPLDRQGDMATIFTDNCDAPGDGTDPVLLDPGVEPVARFAVDVAGVLRVGYDAEAPPLARIWTRFPSPPTADEIDFDRAAVDELLPNNATGCAATNQTFFDVDGTFVCVGEQNVRQLLLRNAGFRSMIMRASADFTSRHIVVDAGGASDTSFIARLFRDATGGQPAETFLRMSGFDWYTLTAFVDRGVISTPRGIDARFEELLVSDGCPPAREPTVPVTEDPFAIDP